MKIAYVSENDSSDIKNWSGLDFFIKHSLAIQDNIEIVTIDKLSNNFRNRLRVKKLLYNITGRRYQAMREPRLLKDYAQQIIERLPKDIDCIFAPSSMPLAYLDIKVPIFFYTDAAFNEMIDYYPAYVNLCKETLTNGFLAEKKALDKAKLAFYASDWAAKSAIKHYHINPDKVKVVPFGANLFEELSETKIQQNISARSTTDFHLLFIGVDFIRKGGNLAFKVAQKLNQNGIKTTLHIVGIPNLPAEFSKDFVINYGYVNKNEAEGKAIFDKLFSESHFLIVPSEAEAYGLVYCEANAYGIPAIGTNTGGIPTIIKNDINGWIFDKENFVDNCYNHIKSTLKSTDTYNKMAKTSFDEYKNRLNWAVSGKKIIGFIKSVL
jgi:glycosyltransferase involved in cell wall biosynthesis